LLRWVLNIVGWQPGGGVLPGEVVAPLGKLRAVGSHLARREPERSRGWFVPVLLKCRHRPRGCDAPLVRRELRKRFAVLLGCDRVQGDLAEPMQVLRAVIGTQVGAMAPQAPVLHQTVLEKDLLAHLDVSSSKQHRSHYICDPLGDGWSVRIGQDRYKGQNREAGDHDEDGRMSPPRRETRSIGGCGDHMPPSLPDRNFSFPIPYGKRTYLDILLCNSISLRFCLPGICRETSKEAIPELDETASERHQRLSSCRRDRFQLTATHFLTSTCLLRIGDVDARDLCEASKQVRLCPACAHDMFDLRAAYLQCVRYE